MGTLQLQWHREVDRFLHTILGGHEGATEAWLVSDPGADGDTGWPSDPPLQHVEHPTASLALAVGMAGKNHWSVSWEQDQDRMVFDVACRVHEPAPLGAVYRALLPEVEWKIKGADAVGLAARGGIALSSETGVWSVRGPYLLLHIPNSAASLPETVRWRYTVRWISPAPPAGGPL